MFSERRDSTGNSGDKMRLNPYKGLFIAVEGLDGSGSNDIALKLVKALVREKLPVVFVKEPSESPIGRFIRKILRERQGKVSPLTLEFLFAADRALQIEERVIPSLKEGKIVVADRCLWSSVAYRSLYYPLHWLLEINLEFFLPDLTFYIDVEPKICAKNIVKGEDEYQIFETESKLSQVREGYQWIWQKFGYCFAFLDGERPQEELVGFIVKLVKGNFKLKKLTGNIVRK